jgi:hypothetical protein
MKLNLAGRVLLVSCLAGLPARADADSKRELKVHLVAANNSSPYVFVRAKFEPGEVADPWAVRFFDEKGAEISFFVWDSITWQAAQKGRADWGHRYGLINHGPGDSTVAVAARAKKLEATKKDLPEVAARLQAREQAVGKAPASVCAAMYLLRRRVLPFGKERIATRRSRTRPSG